MINGLPERLRDARKQIGLSQRTVADRLGISPSIISGYETGERTPSVEILLSIAYLYRCSTDYLLGKDTFTNCPTITTEGLTPQQTQALINLVNSMR